MRKLMGLGLVSLSLAALTATTAVQAAEPHRGGVFRAIASASAGTIDPLVNYQQEYWELFASVYDGLLSFKKVSGKDGATIVPDLAEAMPTVSDDGKTLTFTLRKGIKFSNGKDVTVADVKASFERIFKVLSPTAGSFYGGIVGADACLKTPATCNLDKGVVVDPATNKITIHLTAADSDFYDKLSLPHASILPADAPSKDAGNTPIPGTGPYVIKDYDPNTGLKLVRNPYFKVWSKDAQPDGYIDELDYKFGMTDEAQVTAVQNGQADWMFDDIPADRLAEVASKNAKQIHLEPLAAFYYAALNVNIAPFNNEKVRQALNYAVDRNALVKIWGGPQLAVPTCQVLPLNFPGHEDYCPYASGKNFKPNMAKAKELIKESGIKPGMKVTVITEDKTGWKNMGAYIQSVLNELGFDASIKPLAHSIEYTYINNSNNKAQISLSDWFQDYPAPADFLQILYSCSSFHPGSDSSPNIAGFCDKGIDAQMDAAMKTQLTDNAAAMKQWAAVDKAVVDKAPLVSFFNPKKVEFVGKNVGNYIFNPVYLFMPTLASVK
ncbi:ABC transporter substrate-binding protein [Allorhizobium sp. BGMRC 0089]|uniref:ABC transporter substrate-binding protein n=1 Tax=Allorhizobium sonneratiae TaxID=2934936 RepID=UPI002033D307|nr:ABC transporter substrate-binding protein [Allorhizobium sonneratiae]MCM2293128.1 ABC transporter substrate-binding protein [Allorhizobium sonneratiae]